MPKSQQIDMHPKKKKKKRKKKKEKALGLS